MVKKERIPSYLSPTRLIQKGLYKQEEYEKYKENRQKIQAMNLKERGKELTSEAKYREDKKRYEERSMGGMLGKQIVAAHRVASTRGGFAQGLYRATGQLPPTNVQNRFKTIQGMKSGRKGRPQGTLDKRYAAAGGVYNWRKQQALLRWKERQRILQDRTINPQQQAALNQIRAREAYNNSNQEGKIIPNTDGNVYLDNIMNEINRASNIAG